MDFPFQSRDRDWSVWFDEDAIQTFYTQIVTRSWINLILDGPQSVKSAKKTYDDDNYDEDKNNDFNDDDDDNANNDDDDESNSDE